MNISLLFNSHAYPTVRGTFFMSLFLIYKAMIRVIDYDTEHECRLSENLDTCAVEKDGKDFRRLLTAGLKLYLTFACTRSSLNTLNMLTLFFAEHSMNPHSHSNRTIASFISVRHCRSSQGKSILLQQTTMGIFAPRFLII